MELLTGIMLGAAGVLVFLAYRHGKLAGYIAKVKEEEAKLFAQAKLPASGGLLPRLEAAARRIETAVGGKPAPAQTAGIPAGPAGVAAAPAPSTTQAPGGAPQDWTSGALRA